jgi:ABC-2 type transport system ATP-binding protein
VFVSSHLLSEMALMADHLVVIGRGALIASGKMEDFISTSQRNAVLVRVDDPELLSRELRARNVAVVAEPSGRLVVTGMDSDTIGGLAFDLHIRVFELTGRQATLEEAFLDATGASEEFRASMGLEADGAPGGAFGSSPAEYPSPGQGPPPVPGSAPAQGYGRSPQPGYGPGPGHDPRVPEEDNR